MVNDMEEGKQGMYKSLWRTVGLFLIKQNILFPCHPETLLLGAYHQYLKNNVHT